MIFANSANLNPEAFFNPDIRILDLQNEITLRDLRIKELEEEFLDESQIINLGNLF